MLPLLLLIVIIIYSSNALRTWEETLDSHGFIEEWRSTSDFVPVQSQSFGQISIGQRMSAEFDFVWGGRTNDPGINKYEMFFRVGFDASGGNNCDGQGARYPSFWLAASSNTMQVSASDGDTCQPSNSLTSYGEIQIGPTYHIKIAFNETKLVIDVTGGGNADWREVWNRTATQDQYIGDTVPVWWMSNKYSGTPYNRGAGTFSNVVIKSDIHTLAPTTSIPTTSIPTASIPTTSSPTTSIPATSTSTPTTSIPITSIPTTTKPTINPSTYSPTTAIPTTSNATMYPSTAKPTINATMFPSTYTPTTSKATDPPSVDTIYLYGVEFNIRFNYDVYGNISDNMLNVIFINITDEIIEIETNEIDKECVKKKDYDIDIDKIEKIVVINAMIYVCNKKTESSLTSVSENNLETDLIDIINDNPILIVKNTDISIQVKVTNNMATERPTETTTISTTNNTDSLNDSYLHQTLNIILISVLMISIICCIIFFILYIMNKRKKRKNGVNKNNDDNNNKPQINGLSLKHQIQINSNSMIQTGVKQTNMVNINKNNQNNHNKKDGALPTHHIPTQNNNIYGDTFARFANNKSVKVQKMNTNVSVYKMEGINNVNNYAMPQQTTKGEGGKGDNDNVIALPMDSNNNNVISTSIDDHINNVQTTTCINMPCNGDDV